MDAPTRPDRAAPLFPVDVPALQAKVARRGKLRRIGRAIRGKPAGQGRRHREVVTVSSEA